jgi:hypothetical protein
MRRQCGEIREKRVLLAYSATARNPKSPAREHESEMRGCKSMQAPPALPGDTPFPVVTVWPAAQLLTLLPTMR